MLSLSMIFNIFTLVVVNAESNKVCPGSPSFVHASCSLTAEFVQACEVVADEVAARMKMVQGWRDPHNNGTYTLTDDRLDQNYHARTLEAKRRTGDGKYTDKIKMELQADGYGPSRTKHVSSSPLAQMNDFV